MKSKNGTPERENLPTVVEQLVARAAGQSTPKLSPRDKEALPLLWGLLTPQKLPDPKHQGEGKPRMVLREPLCMISWDPGLGLWKVAVSDRYFQLTTSACSETLAGALEAFESALSNNTAVVREQQKRH